MECKFKTQDGQVLTAKDLSNIIANNGDVTDQEILLYELEQGVLPEEMEGELYGTKDDLDEGLLDELPDVELNEIKKDLEHCLELYESGKAVLLKK